MTLPTFDDNDNNHEIALARASQGFRVFPCNGKRPYLKVYWRSSATTTPAGVDAFWSQHPGAAPAINVGPELVVVDADLDGDNDGMAWLLTCCPEDEREALVATPGCRTPSAGRHLYFRNSGRAIGCGRGRLPPKHTCNVDVKGDGGYVIAPGADTSAWGGGAYELIGDLGALPELPDWLRFQLEPGPWERPERPAGAEVIPLRPDPSKANYGQAALASIIAKLAKVQPGSRSDELWREACNAGELVAGGCFSLEQATAALEGVVKGIWGLALDDKALGPQGTIARGLRKGMSNRARGPDSGADDDDIEIRLKVPGAEAKAEAPKPRKPLIKPYVRVDPKTIPLRPWVYGRILMRGVVSLLVAPGGIGKSSLTIAEALAQATGEPLLGVKSRGRLRVMLWGLEEPEDEVMRRVEAACIYHKVLVEGTDGYLFVPHDDSTELITATVERGSIKIMRPLIDRVCEELLDHKIDVLNVDPFVSSHEAEENSNVMQNRIIKEWTAVARRCNCAIQLVDHTRKLGPDAEVGVESTRGAKAKTDAGRLTRVINRMTRMQADGADVKNHNLYFRVDTGKGNYVKPAEKSDWFELKSVSLENDRDAVVFQGQRMAPEDDEVGVVAAWKYPDALAGMTGEDFQKAAAAIRKGEWRASPSAHAWVGHEVGRVLNIDTGTSAGKARVSQMLKRWIAAGNLVVVEQYVKGDRKARPFVKVKEDDIDEEYDDTEDGDDGEI